MLRRDLRCGLDPAPIGEPDVHHHDIRSRSVGLIDGLPEGAGLSRHVDVFLGSEHRPDPVPHDLVVVHEHDSEGGRFGSAIERC